MFVKAIHKNLLIAYVICVPSGFLTVFIVFTLPVAISGEGLATLVMTFIYGWAIVGLLLSFLAAIGLGALKAHRDLIKGKSFLKTSFNFSFLVNAIIWTVFILLTALNNNDEYPLIYILLPPIIAFLISVVGTTFSLGILLVYLFNWNIKREEAADETEGIG